MAPCLPPPLLPGESAIPFLFGNIINAIAIEHDEKEFKRYMGTLKGYSSLPPSLPTKRYMGTLKSDSSPRHATTCEEYPSSTSW